VISLLNLIALGDDKPRSLNALLEFAPGATIWTLIVFFVALPVMWKFVYGPITKALEDRDQKVEDSILAADKARKDAEAVRIADERAKQELQKARDTIAAEKRQALQEIKAFAVDLTISAAGKLLKHEVDAQKNRPLVQQFVAAAESSGR
jgi:F-type H+-transporting ATPase subunit b